jgi:hypothetical protein
MPTWNRVMKEIEANKSPESLDIVRRQKMERVQTITGRALVVYATDFTTTNQVKTQLSGAMLVSITDKDGFDEVTQNLKDDNLDVLLHSPGGSAEATESIVVLLRERFKHIRFIIPSIAKSAATMLAMSGDQLLMDERSELGPIDPQMSVIRDGQRVYSPAQAIIDQFDLAQEEIRKDPNKIPAWLPILRQYGPSLIIECRNHLKLGEERVAEWLTRYMFAGRADAQQKATELAAYLNDHTLFRSHSRRVGIEDLQRHEANVLDMRTQPELHEAVRDLFAAIRLTFERSGAYKLFENHQSEALINIAITQIIGEPAPTTKLPRQIQIAQQPGKRKGRRVP